MPDDGAAKRGWSQPQPPVFSVSSGLVPPRGVARVGSQNYVGAAFVAPDTLSPRSGDLSAEDVLGAASYADSAAADAALFGGLLQADSVLYSNINVSGDCVEFKVVIDGYMGTVHMNDVERVHASVAQSLAPITSEAYNKYREAIVRVTFPLPVGAILAAPLPTLHPTEDRRSESMDGLKWLLDQHVVHHRVVNLMEKGSDDRSIFTGPERLGKYYTGMFPLTEQTIHRGTCTSSSPTPGAFAAVVEVAKEMFTGDNGVESALLADMRARIQTLLCPDTGTFTFHPSGTDAESVPLLYAVLQSRALAHKLEETCGKIICKGRVVSIVTCAAEVGSGTLDASRGCYFSSETPLNAVGVGPGKKLPYLHKLANIEAIPVQARAEDGERDPRMEHDVLTLARQKLDADPTTVVVLHTIAGSKTGMFAPSWDVTETLTREYGKERIVSVLDACQMRHAPSLIPRWLNNYGLVMVTASKFYGGPSFAGGVLLSNDTVARMQEALETEGPGVQQVVAKALAAYLTSNEICTRMPALCGAFPKDTHSNTGLVLRWAAGLYEMETLQAAIDQVGLQTAQQHMRRWVQELRKMVGGMGPQLDLLPMEDYPGTDYQFAQINSIISIRVRNNDAGCYRSTEELKMVYSAMYNDISALMPERSSPEDLELATKKCLLGQPVPISGNPVLRTCMGAPQFKQLLEAEDFEAELQAMLVQDKVVLDKLAMLGRHFDYLFPRSE